MQIRVIRNEKGIEEWMVLDMQGNIEGSSLEGQLAAWRKDDTEAVLLVGHHLLEGKVTTLDKPFLVTRPSEEQNERKLIVEGIVSRKIIFKNRPKPIVTKKGM